MKLGLTYDDVLLIPQYSEIESREIIDISQDFLGLKLRIPIISANMDFVTGPEMAVQMRLNGGLGILNRFYEWEQQISDITSVGYQTASVAFSVGTRDIKDSINKIRRIERLEGLDMYQKIVCVDVAHGYHNKVLLLTEQIKKTFPRWRVIAGNVATAKGAIALENAGADAVKVGIGPGSVCTTRIVTGVGVPQLTAIMNIASTIRIKTIADGGIKTSGDIVKALAAGADAVMLGNILAGADECPGEIIETGDGRTLRRYRGQSIFGVNGERYVKEGVSGYVETKGPVSGILKQMIGGIRSGMSYLGAKNLTELRENAEFIQITNNGLTEGQPRIGVV